MDGRPPTRAEGAGKCPVDAACPGVSPGVSPARPPACPCRSPGASRPSPRRVPSRSQYLPRGVERLPHRLGPSPAPPRTSSRATPGPLLGRIGELRRVGAVVPHQAHLRANLGLGLVGVQRDEVGREASEVNVGDRAVAEADAGDGLGVDEVLATITGHAAAIGLTCDAVCADLLARLADQPSASPSRSAIARSRSFAACW